MADPDVKKITNLIKVWIPILTFVFGSLGALTTQTFMAGSYAKTITSTAEKTEELEKSLNETIKIIDQTYVRKEVFEESVKNREKQFEYIKTSLEDIKQELRRR